MSVQVKAMPYVRLGKSGLKISKIILGAMQYGSPAWQEWVLDQKTCTEHIKYAYDHGIQTFDTADMYSNGLSEVFLGNAIKELHLPREEIVVMTKVWGPLAPKFDMNLSNLGVDPDEVGLINQHGLSRKHIFAAVKASLERLQLEYIDLLQCHRFDYDTPIEETMQALHDVVQSGLVRYVGMSSCHAYQFHAMQNYAINNKLTPFISMQNHYSLLFREEEREMMPTLKMFGVGSIPWSPLARGRLCRPAGEQTKRASTDPHQWIYDGEPASVDIIKRVEEVAKTKGISMTQVALAWVLAKDPVCAPVVGTTKLENLKEIIGAVNMKLSDDEISYLEEPYRPQAVKGYR